MSSEDRKKMEMMFDVRLMKHNLAKGVFTQKDVETHLKKLPDDSKNADYMEVYEEPLPEEPTPHAVSDKLTFS